jgi:holo-[acyl-carrier protein] synthase
VIFGIGVDVLKAQRMADMLERFGERTAERILMPAEMVQYRRTKRQARFLGLRFAAKEAIVKALGTGFAHGVWIRDVGVVQNAWGRPEVVYSPRGDRLRRKLGVGDGHVTLTDEEGLVVAVAVLLKAAPAEPAPRRRPAACAATKRVATAGPATARQARAGSATGQTPRKPPLPKRAARRTAVPTKRSTRRAR